MSTKLKFQRACKLIPSAENLETRTFALYQGDLYFGGDRSWFKIEGFMDSDVDAYLEMKDLHTIMGMEGDITARKKDTDFAERTMITFSNGKHTLNLYCDGDSVVPPPVVAPLQPQDYGTLPPILSRGRNMLSLITEFATAGVITVKGEDEAGNPEERGYMAVLNQKAFFALKGDPGLDIDVTEIPEVMVGVISQGARIKLDKQVVHCMIEEQDYSIYSAFKYAKSRFMSKNKAFMDSVAMGDKEKDQSPEQPLIRASVNVAQLLEAIPVIDRLSHDGYMRLYIDSQKGMANVKMIDKSNNTFEADIECTSTEDSVLTCNMIDSSTITALCTAVGAKTEEAQLLLHINPWTKHMLLRVEPNEDDVNMLALYKTL